jgi:PAS domain-containing protein
MPSLATAGRTAFTRKICSGVWTPIHNLLKFRMEYRLRRHDGEHRWIFDIGVPRYTQEGSFAGYIGSCVDITERMRAEEARFRQAAIVESSEDAIIT